MIILNKHTFSEKRYSCYCRFQKNVYLCIRNRERCELKRKFWCVSSVGYPVTYTAGITAGATGPVTLAGTLAVGSAECLMGLVIHQLKAPGAPFPTST